MNLSTKFTWYIIKVKLMKYRKNRENKTLKTGMENKTNKLAWKWNHTKHTTGDYSFVTTGIN